MYVVSLGIAVVGQTQSNLIKPTYDTQGLYKLLSLIFNIHVYSFEFNKSALSFLVNAQSYKTPYHLYSNNGSRQ